MPLVNTFLMKDCGLGELDSVLQMQRKKAVINVCLTASRKDFCHSEAVDLCLVADFNQCY